MNDNEGVWFGEMYCNSCGYQWKSRRNNPPARCPNCSSRNIQSIHIDLGWLIVIPFVLFCLFCVCYILVSILSSFSPSNITPTKEEQKPITSIGDYFTKPQKETYSQPSPVTYQPPIYENKEIKQTKPQKPIVEEPKKVEIAEEEPKQIEPPKINIEEENKRKEEMEKEIKRKKMQDKWEQFISNRKKEEERANQIREQLKIEKQKQMNEFGIIF